MATLQDILSGLNIQPELSAVDPQLTVPVGGGAAFQETGQGITPEILQALFSDPQGSAGVSFGQGGGGPISGGSSVGGGPVFGGSGGGPSQIADKLSGLLGGQQQPGGSQIIELLRLLMGQRRV